MGVLADADVTAEVVSPCCGDRARLYACVKNGRITKCTFLAYGCAACIAVASILTEAVVNKQITELGQFDEGTVAELAGGLGPRQRHCATLGRDVLHALAREHRSLRLHGALV
jgi:nitrogen fixation NifU-like protein